MTTNTYRAAKRRTLIALSALGADIDALVKHRSGPNNTF
jgi:hypothetical protein